MTAPAQTLAAEDAVARCAINPRFLYPKDKLFDSLYLLDFKKPKGTTCFITSVGWRKLLPTENDVHEYGCRSAASSNANKSEPPVPLEGAAHYIGFYGLSVKDAMDESNTSYEVHVEQVIENGEAAHCHIVLTEKSGLTKDQQRLKGSDRSNIFYGIWENMTGPFRHVCECDSKYIAELSKMTLPAPGTLDEPHEDVQ